MLDGYGNLRSDGDRIAVRFERQYAGTVAEIWSALTEPARVRRWLAEVVDGVIGPGETFTFRFGESEEERAFCRVRACRPPHLLELDWKVGQEDPSVVRFELSEVNGGTLLVVDHRRLPPVGASGYSAGWHAYLRTLADFDSAAWDARFAAVLPAYRAQQAALT